MEHTLPPLPFARDALAPHLSVETIDYHYGKHHATYVATLNKLIAGTEFASMALEEIVRKSSGTIFNNAGQHWNHSFFWQCLAPVSSAEPSGALAGAITAGFGSFVSFKEKFIATALATFGSGWVWLVKDGAKGLSLESTSNAGSPLQQKKKPVLTCDVWEHAYYIDYRNNRAGYLEAFWKIINWKFAEKQFAEV